MKIILSRKGFDSSYGGMPSPILPDGTLLPLPIPASHDVFTLGDALDGHQDRADLIDALSGGRHSLATTVHWDPDLDRPAGKRLAGWRPSLGQTGSAQSHLRLQSIGAGDVFVFFGWFREAERAAKGWRFVPGAPHVHLIFGWLEVAEALPLVLERERCLDMHPWIADHPHVASPGHYTDSRNTLYIAPLRSRLKDGAVGGGRFTQYREVLRLTANGASRSTWQLPRWFEPRQGRPPLTFHGAAQRWTPDGDHVRLKSVAKGQEFILDCNYYPEAAGWLRTLVEKGR